MIDPTIHHRLDFVGIVVGYVTNGVVVIVVTVVGIAVTVATAEIRKGSGVDTVGARIIIRSVAWVVPRLETVETGIAIVGALI